MDSDPAKEKLSVLHLLLLISNSQYRSINPRGGCSGRDRMAVGFITTYAISAYHH